jgi:hypothetical protein
VVDIIYLLYLQIQRDQLTALLLCLLGYVYLGRLDGGVAEKGKYAEKISHHPLLVSWFGTMQGIS